VTYPSAWQFVVLTLAAYRLTRLAGWDEFPLAAKTRAWVTGLRWVPDEADQEIVLPGKSPGSEVPTVRPAYDRPIIAHLVSCPFCIGAWISFAVYGAWLGGGRITLIALTPFAISGAVGLLAKNLDA
jgi:hypothetical protein